MNVADLFRFLLIIGLGVLAFITFLVAGTIIGLMWLETSDCHFCRKYPVGLWILGITALLFIYSMTRNIDTGWDVIAKWIRENTTAFILVIVILLVFFFIFLWYPY